MRRWIGTAAALAGAFAAVGFLIAALGIVPIKASSGHWAMTDWFLHFAMRRSVVMQSLGIAVPGLDDPDLALKGAGHYENGCRPCHGSPDTDLPRIARAMTPSPPTLASRIPEWKPRHLFYIVKHGIKFTGMPAWPTQQRDDEVWAMVAFLRTLPGLDAEGYRRLVHGDTADDSAIRDRPEPVDIPEITVTCANCHGPDGRGRGSGAFPALAGQRPAYLHAALRAYARGQRHSGLMELVAGGLRSGEARALARYYAGLSQRPAMRSDRAPSRAVERGRAIARARHPQPGGPVLRRLSWSDTEPQESTLSDPRRAVRGLPRPPARAVQDTTARRFGVRAPNAAGGVAVDRGAGARGGAIL